MQDLWNWVWGATAVFFVMELAAGRYRGIYNRDELLVTGLCALLGLTVRPLLAGLVALFIGVVFPAGRGALAEVPFWLFLPVIILVAEFGGYWMHRLAHRAERHRYFDWLWRLHRTHHTANYMNVLLQFRVNFAWALVSGLTWVLTAAFYLGQELAASVAGAMFALYSIVTHCDFRWDDAIRRHRFLGPLFRGLEHIIVSPGVHHTHHGYGRDGATYCNFGNMLSVYDWLFGTLKIPRGRPGHYGLPRPRVHWAEEVFFPLFWKKAPAVAKVEPER